MQHHRILYRSDLALVGPSEDVAEQLQAIVAGSQARNSAADLTGALMLSSGVFIQALEGPCDAVEQTFERICRDLRHRRVRLLEYTTAETRQFAEWSMARVTPTRELARIGPVLDLGEDARMDAVSTGAIVELMRSLLISDATNRGRADISASRR